MILGQQRADNLFGWGQWEVRKSFLEEGLLELSIETEERPEAWNIMACTNFAENLKSKVVWSFLDVMIQEKMWDGVGESAVLKVFLCKNQILFYKQG